MSNIHDEKEREKIFHEELKLIKDEGYIEFSDYQKVGLAYIKYRNDVKNNNVNKVESVNENQDTVKENKVVRTAETTQSKPIKQKVKKVKSPEEIRERNITWSLILGVILVLISGLVVATSNWDNMSAMMKVGSIGLVAILFLSLSWVSENLLKIHKTSVAFLTLGSLFLPIVVLSAGYFEVFGEYLSLTGEGKYLLGLIGCLICLPLYIRNAYKHKSRLFVWISYITSTILVGFLLQTIKLPQDAFYLGVILYNALLLYGYHKLKNKESYILFTKELPVYAQLNLIISTLLMLFFFENEVFYSFNILLTAVLYMSMAFVYNTKHYQFVFTGLIAYGCYQLINSTPLENINIVMYALVGFIYLGLQYYYKDNDYLRKMFQLASGVISFLAFIFISIEGFLLNTENPSILLLISYLLISINYIYLAYLTKNFVFKYLGPSFMIISGYQLYSILEQNYDYSLIEVHMFIVATLVFIGFYLFDNKYINPIKYSSFNLSILTMIGSIFIALTNGIDIILVSLFIAFSVVGYISSKTHTNNIVKGIFQWIAPISFVLGLLSLYGEITGKLVWYADELEITTHFAIVSLVLLGISYLFKQRNDNLMHNSSFFVSIVTYTLGLFTLVYTFGYMNTYVSSLILAIGVALYTLLVRKTKVNFLYILVSITSLALYFSFIAVFEIEDVEIGVPYLLFAPVVLLLVYEFVGRKYKQIKPYFFWLAHFIQPFIIFLALISFYLNNLSSLIFFIPLFVYIYSTLKQVKEWKIKLFLYATFTMIPLVITANLDYFNLDRNIPEEYIYLFSSIVMGIIWFISNTEWKRRIDWYIIPFSLIGVIAMANFQSLEFIDVALTIIYTLFVLYLLHVRKWTILAFIPLANYLIMWYSVYNLENSTLFVIYIISFFVMKESGRFLFEKLFEFKNKIYIDWYSIISLGTLIGALNSLDYDAFIWIKIIPFVLFTYWLYSQIKRFDNHIVQKAIQTATVVSVMIPYYMILDEYYRYIPEIIEAELYALPWIAITVGLSLKTWNSYKKVMKNIQLVILLIVTAVLVVDALNSNTIHDALIIGTLSLISIICGMKYHIKFYFFVGVGVLLLNVFIQTKPFWGNVPWWVYLLVAGSTLIGIASYNEYSKQKKDNDIVKSKIKEFMNKFKDWD